MVTESQLKRSWRIVSWITIASFVGFAVVIMIFASGSLLQRAVIGAALVVLSLSGAQGLRDRWVIDRDVIRHRSLLRETSWSAADLDHVEEWTPSSQYRLHLRTGAGSKMVDAHRMENRAEVVDALKEFSRRHEVEWVRSAESDTEPDAASS